MQDGKRFTRRGTTITREATIPWPRLEREARERFGITRFRPGQRIAQPGSPPVLALTATATPDILADITRQLRIDGARIVNTGIDRPNLFFEVQHTVNTTAKRERLRRILEEIEGVGIVYVATVKLAEELCEWLRAAGVAAGCYHGRMADGVREETQRRFMADEYHRRFGSGEVVAVDPEGVTAAFPAAGVTRFDAAYLERAR